MIDRVVRRHTTLAFRNALRTVRHEYRVLRKHRQGVMSAGRYRDAVKLKLHLGCGPNIKAGWINVDLSSRADLTLDLRESLPFGDGSCAVVYSEHFLEHVDYPDATIRLLHECLRVLEPGGVLSVGVPDTEWPLMEYAKVREEGYFATAKAMWHPAWCQTELEHVNFHFRQGTEHRFAYDLETLQRILSLAGFVNVVKRPFDPATDSDFRRLGTLYVAASKPESGVSPAARRP